MYSATKRLPRRLGAIFLALVITSVVDAAKRILRGGGASLRQHRQESGGGVHPEIPASETPGILPKRFPRRGFDWHQPEAFEDLDGGGEDIPYTVLDDPNTPAPVGGDSYGECGPQRNNRTGTRRRLMQTVLTIK